ncbi:E3 ubiquitin-protein ligase CHIP-like [Pecten maximus]|uniref:E3 ubiquitin-protein ligase CHIP-like n=1 Tax=Pecten maximus TaxID=6579 RepID=UPI00145916EE|nr:E3 ubiquitin-protein ligase CHIP-like [Pecten maximus]
MSAVELKDQGNKYFASRNYDSAASCYTKAIIKSPNTPTFYTNRSLCYLKLKNWEAAIQDCRKALDLDRASVKGHFFLGQALVEMGLYDEATTSLNRAHDLAKEQKLNFGDEITGALRMAKRKRWNVIENKRIQEEIELQTYLNRLVKEEAERQRDAILNNTGEENVEERLGSVDDEHEKRLKEVNDLFAQLDVRRKTRDVPDYLCGKISFELMREPVITPSGITYDKKDIVEHLQRVGHFDPVTRADLKQEQLIPNLAMKEVMDIYLEENPWAEDF